MLIIRDVRDITGCSGTFSVSAGLPKSTHWPCTPAAQFSKILLLILIHHFHFSPFLTPRAGKVFCRERGEKGGEEKSFHPERFITLEELKINERQEREIES